MNCETMCGVPTPVQIVCRGDEILEQEL